jgi:hypothetical protein
MSSLLLLFWSGPDQSCFSFCFREGKATRPMGASFSGADELPPKPHPCRSPQRPLSASSNRSNRSIGSQGQYGGGGGGGYGSGQQQRRSLLRPQSAKPPATLRRPPRQFVGKPDHQPFIGMRVLLSEEVRPSIHPYIQPEALSPSSSSDPGFQAGFHPPPKISRCGCTHFSQSPLSVDAGSMPGDCYALSRASRNLLRFFFLPSLVDVQSRATHAARTSISYRTPTGAELEDDEIWERGEPGPRRDPHDFL